MKNIKVSIVSRQRGAWKHAKTRVCYRVIVRDDAVLAERLRVAPPSKKKSILSGWESNRLVPGKTCIWESHDVCGDYKGGKYGYASAEAAAHKIAEAEAQK